MSELGTPPGWQAGTTQKAVASLLAMPDRQATATWVLNYATAFRAFAQISHIVKTSPAIVDFLHRLGSASTREHYLRGHNTFLTAGADFRHFGLNECLDQILRGHVDAPEIHSALELGFVRASFELQKSRGSFDTFSAAHQNEYVQNYSATLNDIRSILPPILVSDALKAQTHVASDNRLRMAALRRALERKKGKRKVRDLVEEFGDLITALTPCILVSPDSVARFFPAGRQDFDLVVFDEASQITVAAAIGAMGRGRSVIVCGDSQQMPPTSFAELSRDENADDEPMDEESILSECVAAHVPRLLLSWHYRSQSEDLIAFSNKSYYQGRLSSFPSPRNVEQNSGMNGFGISLRRINGQFIRSIPRERSRRHFRTNPAEAEAIVDEIRRRFEQADCSSPSLGVITFNTQQRDLIETRLRDLDNRRITASLDTDGGIFIKNLENVQGDERDTILFSVAFSANEYGDIPLNFGPLNRQGGERRLNVAITRAKKQVIVFCSFAPAQLQAERSGSKGLQDLKRYLVLAEQGAHNPEEKTFGKAVPDRHRDDVAQALREAGLKVTTDVGLSDFRIDLVLARAEQPDAPLVAVLLDGTGWSERRTVYDRDVLPIEVLTQMGWSRVERLWLPQWLQDRDGVIEYLLHVVNEVAEKNSSQCPAEEIALDSEEVVSNDVAQNSKTNDLSPVTHEDAKTVDERWGTEQNNTASSAMAPLQSTLPAKGSTPPGTDESKRSDLEIRSENPRSRDLAAIIDFVPVLPRPRGPREVLDDASTNWSSRKLVHTAAREICEVEFPIAQHRFLSLVCNAFGLKRMTASRKRKVHDILRGSGCSVDTYGFVWPENTDQSQLTGYRRYAFDYLPFNEIHPRELDNYIRDTLSRVPLHANNETVLRTVFEGLGVKPHRLTASVRQTLENAIFRIRNEGVEAT